jgi:hypothetical protein
MEGIMNLPANVGGATSQDGLDSFAPLIAAQQAARDMGYPRFTRELLSAGSEMDQAEVQEFLQTIRDAGLTSEDVALMRRVVEAVFGDPNNYPEVRARLLAEGVPEDILPETFDLEFFVALRMAVEEAENLSQEPRPTGQDMPMDMPIQMAEGGIVGLPEMTPIAREMAAMGRNGDTMLAHITPQEAMMLKRMGGSGTINPYTGLPEFFIGKLFKSLVKGIKKFAKSTIGRIVISVALGAFLGPAAAGFLGASSTAAVAAISGAVGGFGSSLLAGDGLKAALRSGLTGAVLAGGTAAIAGGSAALQGRPGFEAAYAKEGFLGTVKQTAQNYFGSPVDTAKQMYGTETAPGASDAGGVGGVKTAQELVQAQPPAAGTGPSGTMALDGPVQPRLLSTDGSIATAVSDGTGGQRLVMQPSLSQSFPGMGDAGGTGIGGAKVGAGYNLTAPDVLPQIGPPTAPSLDYSIAPGVRPSTPVIGPSVDYSIASEVRPSTAIGPSTPGGAERGFFDKTIDFFSPSAREAAGKQAAEQAFQETLARTKSTALAEKAYQAALPGTVSKYLPLVAGIGTVGVGTGMIGSPFDAPEIPAVGMTPEQRAEAQETFLKENPQFRGPIVRPEYYSQPTYRAARGSGPEGVENFPRKNGAINGPGTGTSDDIPAMLSDGEFVFTAKSVRNMGGGSRRKGAAKMYKLMKMLEGGPVSKTAGA